jgi:DegV family protein with EDD domain
MIAFSVDTLEFLERGGRINSVAAKLGGALQVKPILHLVNGVIERRDLVRTGARAFTRLVDIAMNAYEPGRPIAVHHVADPASATMLAQALTSRLGVADIPVSECGAVIATHTGPGALAVVVGPQAC